MKTPTRFVTAILAVLGLIALFVIPLPKRVGLDTRVVTVRYGCVDPTRSRSRIRLCRDCRSLAGLASVIARAPRVDRLIARSGRAGDGELSRRRLAWPRRVDSGCTQATAQTGPLTAPGCWPLPHRRHDPRDTTNVLKVPQPPRESPFSSPRRAMKQTAPVRHIGAPAYESATAQDIGR